MRILMLAPVLPLPPNNGGFVRICHILAGLRRHYDVTFVAPCEGDSETAAKHAAALGGNAILVPGARRGFVRRLKAGLSAAPYHTALYYEPEMARQVSHLLHQGFSLAYLHFIHSLSYIPRQLAMPVVVDQQNVDRDYWERKVADAGAGHLMRLFFRWNQRRTTMFETGMLGRISGYVSVSEMDRMRTMSYARRHVPHFLLAPNGVDLGHFRPKQCSDSSRNNRFAMGFMGSLDLAVNQRAAELLYKSLLPMVQARLPSCKVSLVLIGSNPPRFIREVAAHNPTVQITGTVPDVLPWLHTVDLLVLPLTQGAGTKLRTLEAMAAGVPVVGFPLAFEGLDEVIDGQNARIAARHDALCEAVVDLALHPELRTEMAQAARRLVEERYGWDQITDKLAEDLAELVRQCKPDERRRALAPRKLSDVRFPDARGHAL